MIQIHYRADERDNLRQHCERCGVTGFADGTSLRGAWVSANRQGFMLLEAVDAGSVSQVCTDLSRFGSVTHTPVISIDQIL
jgi:hypothetical protein